MSLKRFGLWNKSWYIPLKYDFSKSAFNLVHVANAVKFSDKCLSYFIQNVPTVFKSPHYRFWTYLCLQGYTSWKKSDVLLLSSKLQFKVKFDSFPKLSSCRIAAWNHCFLISVSQNLDHLQKSTVIFCKLSWKKLNYKLNLGALKGICIQKSGSFIWIKDKKWKITGKRWWNYQIKTFFICYLAAARPILGHCQGRQLH